MYYTLKISKAINALFCGRFTEKFENKQVLDYKATRGAESEKLPPTSNGTYMDGYSHPESMRLN